MFCCRLDSSCFLALEALEGMNKKFEEPYIIFFPVVSRDGITFPENQWIKKEQGNLFRKNAAWRGNIVVAKYRDPGYSEMQKASMADLPLVKNYLSNHGCTV